MRVRTEKEYVKNQQPIDKKKKEKEKFVLGLPTCARSYMCYMSYMS